MSESFLNGRVQLMPGNCLDVLARLEENSIDSVVTDPPYHLTSISKPRKDLDNYDGGKGNPYARRQAKMSGFMGKQWDGGEIAFEPETWAAVMRVLKPGGHLLAFGAPKNFGFMQYAIAQAGFEVRDVLCWLFGSGFPKSHDVSKGIDRKRDDKREAQAVGAWLRQQRERRGLKQKEVAALWPSATGGLTGCVANWELGFNCPQWDQWLSLQNFIGFGDEMDAEVWRLNGRKGTPGEAWGEREIIGRATDGSGNGCVVGLGTTGNLQQEYDLTAPATDAAKQWEGWGTALKPAYEPIILARKPLSESTVAANVLRWGTGALNIDGCRVEASGRPAIEKTGERWAGSNMDACGSRSIGRTDEGRWPANVLHDGSDEVVRAFPETDGVVGALHDPNGSLGYHGGAGGAYRKGTPDSGSAARFFYSSKADSDDRLGSKHPTVKPVDLMQWLCRLVTSKGGTVLDCFAGTGTTAEAAWREGFNAVLIEREEEYCNDIRRRMALCLSGPAERKRESNKARHGDKPFEAGTLFG